MVQTTRDAMFLTDRRFRHLSDVCRRAGRGVFRFLDFTVWTSLTLETRPDSTRADHRYHEREVELRVS